MDAQIEAGMPFWANRPDLAPEAIGFWEGYWTLDPSRTVTMGGPGNIPLPPIVAYLELIGEEDVDRKLFFVHVMAKMDEVYLKHIASKNAAISGSGTQG